MTVSKCLNPPCTNEAPVGFATCSGECAKAYRNAEVGTPRAVMERDAPHATAADGTVSTKELAEILGVSYQSICNWARAKQIPVASDPTTFARRFKVEEVKAALADKNEQDLKKLVKTAIEMPSVKVNPINPKDPASFGGWVGENREKKEARGRTRQEIGNAIQSIAAEMFLEAAEEFAAKGDFENAYLVLRDRLQLDLKMGEIFK